ncbi:MAG: aminotransferase class I/II-fold pyridoxal phosphate-dependent enzyme [Bacteroidota bacterium]
MKDLSSMTVTGWEAFFEEELAKREEKGLYRSLHHSSGLTDFFSNDYLGFAKKNTELPESFMASGSGGARLISGNYPLLEETEKVLADFHDSEEALIFNSGYTANLGFFSAFTQRDITILYDELSHASIRDGIRLSLAKSFSFRHNDVNDLEEKLKRAEGKIIIAVESVYSMDGDFAPLKEIVRLAEKYNAFLFADEAHAGGVFGEKGEGRVVEEGWQKAVHARLITFGKAWGLHGAVILCSSWMKKFLVNFSRPFIYTTALPPIAVFHILKRTGEIKNASSQRELLKSNIRYFRENISGMSGFLLSSSPVQSCLIKGNIAAKKKAEQLRKKGLDVKAILSPTVPEGKERIRICLHSFNTKNEIDLLLNSVKENE